MAMAIATMAADADTLKIGVFNLPYRFEDTNITDIVRYVVTNDVQAFCSPISAFREPYQDGDGHVCVQRINTPETSLYHPQFFKNGIKFYIENGQTNCVIKQSLTDAAKAIESDLPTRTNLACSARQFIDSIMDGTITNLPISELRSRTRVYRDGTISIVSETEGSNDIILQNFLYFKEQIVFYPLSIMDSKYVPSGTNSFYTFLSRFDRPNVPSYARSIDVLPIVYADGYWSICLEE